MIEYAAVKFFPVLCDNGALLEEFGALSTLVYIYSHGPRTRRNFNHRRICQIQGEMMDWRQLLLLLLSLTGDVSQVNGGKWVSCVYHFMLLVTIGNARGQGYVFVYFWLRRGGCSEVSGMIG